MQSGIPDYMNVPGAAVEELASDPARVFSADDLIGYGVAKDIQPAGTGGYSTTNYIALQEIAETVTEQSLAELIEQRLTGPLGMSDTALPPNEDTTLPDPATHGYINEACIAELEADGAFGVEAGTDTTDWNASYGQGGGGMHSTIEDSGRLGRIAEWHLVPLGRPRSAAARNRGCRPGTVRVRARHHQARTELRPRRRSHRLGGLGRPQPRD